MKSENIHANTISLLGKGILILGPSGSGKSDISLRLICNHNAVLIADDRTLIQVQNGVLKASCPKNIKGLLEVRGVGICKIPHKEKATISLVVELVDSLEKITRLPENRTMEILNIQIPSIKIYPFEVSAPEKIIAAICYQKTENILPFKSD
ncbi:MAG: HPr kinase/phosphatase C-terminal domain-containing protein [Alphaproteobacteria bacterium]|nr:HPr kinase/phosphatase C-terminal domain-containing protein [Alphaproteobacteria bacterium]